MHPDLAELLSDGDGLTTWADVARAGPPVVAGLKRASRAGELVRLLPGVWLDAGRVDDVPLRRRAALSYAGESAALSHITALAVWGLYRPEANEPTHLTVPTGKRLEPHPGLVVHHSRTFEPSRARVRSGLSVTALERSLVDSWPLQPEYTRPGPIIEAVNNRLTTPERIQAAAAGVHRLCGRRELMVLVDKLAAGCRSALEIWGFDHVFRGGGMPEFGRQHRVRVAGHTFYLDLYAEEEQVNFELDGAASHGSVQQREADLRRDALLATVGILVVRFSAQRLRREPARVHAESLAILARRRR